MKIYSCWIKISFSSNPESFQILVDEIVNSLMFKSCNFTMNILKRTKGQSESAYQRTDNTMAKRKRTKGKTTIYKTYISSERSSNASYTKDRSEHRCSRRVCRSCCTSNTRCVNLVTNPLVIVTQILHNINQVMVATVTFSKWWLHLYQNKPCFSSFRASSILYQGNPDRSHKL